MTIHEREEKLCQFQTLWMVEIKSQQIRKEAHANYHFNECGQSILLVETIASRVLQFLSLESLFVLCGTSRKLGETLATLVERHPLKSISCHSIKTLDRLSFFWHSCFTAPNMRRDLFQTIHTLRIKVRHNPFLTYAVERDRCFNSHKRSDLLLKTKIKTLILEATEEADVDDFFSQFYVGQKETIVYCVVDPIKYYGREWTKPGFYAIPTKRILDFRGLKYASLTNMTINEG